MLQHKDGENRAGSIVGLGHVSHFVDDQLFFDSRDHWFGDGNELEFANIHRLVTRGRARYPLAFAWGDVMTEPEPQKPVKSSFFTRKRLAEFVASIIISGILGSVVDLSLHAEKRAELASYRASAYTTIAQFAPWNVALRYVQIVVTQGNDAAEEMADQQQRRADLFRGFACRVGGVSGSSDNPCVTPERPHGIQAFYLSAHVPFVFRFITAFFDLVLHALIDQGIFGFLVAATQIAIGAMLTRVIILRANIKLDSFYKYILGVPAAVLALGSFAALPLWMLAFIGVTVFKGLPGAGLGAQLGGTGYLARWFGTKAVEEVGHRAIMKQFKRVIGD